MDHFWVAILAGLSGMLGWGISDFLAKKTITRIGYLRTAVGAQAVGGAIMLACFLLAGNSAPAFHNIFSGRLVGLALLHGAGYLLLYRAFQKGAMTIVSPIAASSAALSAVVSFLAFGEKMSGFKIAGLALIFSGILLTTIDFAQVRSGALKGSRLGGVPEALAVMVMMGLWFPLWNQFVFGEDFLFWLIALKVLVGLMLVVIFYILHPGENLLAGVQSVGWLMFFVAAIDTAAYLGVSWGFHATDSATSLITMIAHAYSVPTIVLAYFLLKERVARSQQAGIAAILLGIAVSSFS